MIETDAFPEIRMKIDKLIKITNEYAFEDLVRAIYCVNLCINNRSVLESCLALNACLIEYAPSDCKRIKNYAEFQDFYNRIHNLMKPGITDDLTVEDFGEVRINYQEKFYRVIVGTGHSNVFAAVNFLTTLAMETGHEDELSRILEYSSDTIEYFLDVNINDNVQEKRFVLPSEDLFNRVHLYFDEECNKYNFEHLAHLFEEYQNIIEKAHFVRHENVVYPLYNVSILLDIYDLWVKNQNSQNMISIANHGIIDRIYSLFETDRANVCSMLSPVQIFPNKKFDSSQPKYTFLAKCSKGAIVAINVDEYDGDLLEYEISKINTLHARGELFVGESFNRFSKNCLRGMLIPKDVPLEFLIYNSFINPSQTYMSLSDDNRKNYSCTALDVIYYLNFMNDTDELYDYLTYNKKRDFEMSFGFGSDAACFLTWKSNEHYIAKGAIVFDLLNLGYDIENEFVVQYFRNELRQYPFHDGDYIFQEPFSWKIVKRDSGKTEMSLKYGIGFGGLFIPLQQDYYIFLTTNLEFYKNVRNFGDYLQLIHMLEEIVAEGIETVANIFSDSFLKHHGIQITFMPIEYARTAGNESFLHEDRVYVYSDACCSSGKWIIRYVVKDINQIYQYVKQADNREIEFGILREILYPMLIRMPEVLQRYDETVERYKNNKKKVEVLVTNIDYIWDSDIIDYSIREFHYHEVRKRIANVCFAEGIVSGRYSGDEANQLIRSMQEAIIKDFEKEVSCFSREGLHMKLLAYHSTLLHDINLNHKRFRLNENIDEDKSKEVREKIIAVREKAKHDNRNVLYLIETNLFLDRDAKKIAITNDICFLIAYANWLVVLNDVADMCHFSDKEAYIEITEEYVVNILSDEDGGNAITGLQNRIYKYSDGIARKKEIDLQYYEKVKVSLSTNLGFDFNLFMVLLSYFANSFSNTIVKYCGANVYRATFEKVIDDFQTKIGGNISRDDIERIFCYLCLDVSQLKTINETADFFLPISNRRNRKNRFELMPLVKDENDIIFSPIVMEHLKKDWLNGIFDFRLPYEVGMAETKKILVEWKSKYEKQIVFDVEAVFVKKGFDVVKHNFELKKLSKDHPQFLGDYDVFAVDCESKSIWIIECKVIEKVATFYDMYRQQKRFFQEHKEDEKFQRRIDYLRENSVSILQQLQIKDCEGYKVIPYMCMNKVLESRYKDISFPIVAFPELVDIINKS